MHITKMQGIGNDYVYINCMEKTPENPGKLAVTIICDSFYGFIHLTLL